MRFQSIVTKYIGPSNTRGSRVKATAEAGSVTLSWEDAWNSDRNHIVAAQTLAAKFGWRGNYYGGAVPGSGYVFVCYDPDEAPAFSIER